MKATLELIQNAKNKKPNNSIRKQAKDLKGDLTEKDLWMANKSMKRCSTLLDI